MYVLLIILVGKEIFSVWWKHDLTGLLSECGRLALAVLRHSDHTNVIVDARLQPVDRILASRRQNHVFKDGHALAGRHHRDPVTGDGCGVERRPAETDAGVAHVFEGDVLQLWDIFVGGERKGREKTTETPNEREEKVEGKGWGCTRGPERGKIGAVVKASGVFCSRGHVQPPDDKREI